MLIEQTPIIIPGCLAWLDFADTSTITSSSNLVSAVRNKARSTVTFTQATGSRQPTTNATTVQGRNVLSFSDSGAGTGLDSQSGVFNPNSQFSIFIASQINNVTTFGNLLAQGTIGGYLFSSNAAYPNKKLGTQVGSSLTSSSNIPNSFNIFSISYNGTNVVTKVNNVTFTTSASTPTSTTNVLIIGNASAYSFGLLGTMGEVVIYNRFLSTSEETSVNKYLSDKWGISV